MKKNRFGHFQEFCEKKINWPFQEFCKDKKRFGHFQEFCEKKRFGHSQEFCENPKMLPFTTFVILIYYTSKSESNSVLLFGYRFL